MGINDFAFSTTANELVTCSSDRSLKVWKMDVASKALDEVKTLSYTKADLEQITDNVEKQVLGVLVDEQKELILSASCNSDINVWQLAQEGSEASQTLRGHSNTVTKVVALSESTVVSGDQDGRILVWDTKTGLASRPPKNFRHKIQVVGLAANATHVYSGSADATMMQFEICRGEESKSEGGEVTLKPTKDAFVKKGSSILQI
mmetsp:Transcript_9265/g.15584  ORF Transcript_9265/g.15584 Transcript_9265/m.15584 type:complete len:204 (-) Transcript_9265:632-1243(-)